MSLKKMWGSYLKINKGKNYQNLLIRNHARVGEIFKVLTEKNIAFYIQKNYPSKMNEK